MDNPITISQRAVVLAAVVAPVAAAQSPLAAEMLAMSRIRELSRELSHLLNDLPEAHRLTIEPSDTAVYPVVLEVLNPDRLPDHLAMMNRGLTVLERGAKMRDPSINGLGLLWDVDDGRFGGVAVSYGRKAVA